MNLIHSAKGLLRTAYTRAARLAYGRHLGRFGPVKMINDVLRSRLVPAASPILVQLPGRQMFVDAQDSLSIALFGVYEPETTDLVKRLLRPGDVFLDIGANVGWFTLLAAGLVGESGKVFAFEPEPANFALLQKNIALNAYQNVVPVQKAVAEQNGTVTLYLSEVSKGDHSLYDSGAGHQSIGVDAVRLDEYSGMDVSDIRLIKMDIEGSEGHALKGMGGLLSRNPGVSIIAEFSPHLLEQCGTPAQDVLAMLSSQGFSFYTIGSRSVAPISADALLQTYGGEPPKHTNILCVRPDRQA